MSRLRPAVATACLAALLFAALPAPGAAQRDAVQVSAHAGAEPLGERFVGSVLAWGRVAISWLQAIIAEEHGTVVETPVVPPKP
jgi:hypothetical protein